MKENRMNWKQIKRHFANKDDLLIVLQILAAAKKYPFTCTECHWGEPIGFGIVNLPNVKTARKCFQGRDLVDYPTNARRCPGFRRHSALRLFRLSYPSELSQRGLSKLSGVPLRTIRSHETGSRNMSYKTAQKYADVFGCQAVDLL